MHGKSTRGLTVCVARLGWIFILVLPFQLGLTQEQIEISAGEQVFQASCFACHGIGEAQRVGPDLAGINDRRSPQWLQRFVRSPKAVFDSGDADAIALFENFTGMVMPDSTISDQQITAVLAYIRFRTSSLGVTDTATTVASATIRTVLESNVITPVSVEDISTGGDLFQGKIRFENSGPACNACHDVRNDAVMGGGALAVDLTSVYSKMGAAGLTAILSRPPFPAMQTAYNENPLMEAELDSLLAFFQNADAESASQQQINHGLRLFLSGVLGAAFLFGLLPLIWRDRKIGSVNQSIYDRKNTHE